MNQMRLNPFFTGIIAIVFLAACSYLPEDTLNVNLVENELSETADVLILKHKTVDPVSALLFYPGGLVDPHVYLKWQDLLIKSHPELMIITVRMPSNLAVLDAQKGKKILEEYPEIQHWYAAGHSLGGTMAAELIGKNPDQFDAMVFIASYPASDVLKNWQGAVLSISASQDGLSTPADIQASKDNLPFAKNMSDEEDFILPLQSKTHFYEISGGNHAQFGNYGLQSGDGIAGISSEEQQEILIQLIHQFLLKL